jgi:hypothetical protein
MNNRKEINPCIDALHHQEVIINGLQLKLHSRTYERDEARKGLNYYQ